MIYRLFFLIFILYALPIFSQNSIVKPLIYPQLKTVNIDAIDYSSLLGEKKVPRGFDLYYPKHAGSELLAFNECVEGNCNEGEGVLIYIEKLKSSKPNAKNTETLKARAELFEEKYWQAREKRKKFNTKKYYIDYQDKLIANDVYTITYSVLKGNFSKEGERFKGKKYTYEVNYNRNGKAFIPEVNINFKNLNTQNLVFEGEFKADLVYAYLYHGIGKDKLYELDPDIEEATALYGRGFPRMLSIKYKTGHPIKSFFGIPGGGKENYIFGRIIFENGIEYIGGLLNNNYNGIGILKNPDGSIQQGLWLNGDLVKTHDIKFPEVMMTTDLTQINYKEIQLYEDDGYSILMDYFYFGELKDGLPHGLGVYLNTYSLNQFYIGEIFTRVPGDSYFYYSSYKRQLKSGVKTANNSWEGIAFASDDDIESNYFKQGEMIAYNDGKRKKLAEPNINYGKKCIKILPNSEAESEGFFQSPEGWLLTTTGKKYFATTKQHARGLWRYYDTSSTHTDRVKSETLNNMITNNTLCSPNFTREDKQKIIDRQLFLIEAKKQYEKELAEIKAREAAAKRAFNNCWKPQIVMSSNPAQTYTYCNGHKTYGRLTPVSQIRYGDVIQYNGAMYEVNKNSYGTLTLLCDLEISGNSFYVFDKLNQVKDALREYCDCSGYKYVTHSFEVPNGRKSVVYQNSVVTMVKSHTDTRSLTYRVKSDCKSECGGVVCWPSNYAKGI